MYDCNNSNAIVLMCYSQNRKYYFFLSGFKSHLLLFYLFIICILLIRMLIRSTNNFEYNAPINYIRKQWLHEKLIQLQTSGLSCSLTYVSRRPK